jgi:fibronectin-binding autotransporter adhesin
MNRFASARSPFRNRRLSLAAAVATVLAGSHVASAQTTGAFTFSGDLGNGDLDASVGLSTTKTYLDAYNLGTATNVIINGVTFTGVGGANPTAAGFSTTGLPTVGSGGTNPGGQLGVLTNTYVEGSGTTPEVFTFSNLTAGQAYVVSFYNKASSTGTRVQNLSASGASVGTGSYDENTASAEGNLNVLRYTFQAGSTTQTISFTAAAANPTSPDRQYGFSLEQTFNNTWTGGNTWTTSTWTGGAAVPPNSAGSNANFTAQAAPTTIDLDASRTVGHIQFAGANAWTIGNPGGNTLTLQADVGGAATLSALSGSHTIAPNITLASPTTLKLGAGAITLTGNITGGAGNALQVSAGTLTLTGNNSARTANASGLTTVNSGAVLQLQANAGNTTGGISTALSSERIAGQALVVNSGGTLQLRGDSSVTFAGGNNLGGVGGATVTFDVDRLSTGTNNTLTLAPGGFAVNITTINVTGANGYTLGLGTISNIAGASGVLTLNPTTASLKIGGYATSNPSTLALGGTAAGNSITGAVTGATTLTKTGISTWTLNGADTYTGAINVLGGTLVLAGAKTGTTAGITVSNLAGTDATLNISNGTYALGASSFVVGNAPTTAATGTVNQSGGAVSFTSGQELLVGNGGGGTNLIPNTGTYNLSGGSITTSASATRGIILGVNHNAIANFTLSGTGTLNMTLASGGGGDSTLQVGRSDAATNFTTSVFTQTGGTANVGILTIGGTTGSTGHNDTMTLTGGTFSANQFTKLSFGNSDTSVINIGGTADVTLPAFPTARGTSSTAEINFDGGTLRPLAASATYLGGLSNAYIKAGGARFDVASGRDITITQDLLTHPISANGGLTKDGVGTLTLTGTSTYTGPTAISAGTLLVSGNISGSTTTVSNNATLGGASGPGGTVGPVTVLAGGIVAPGAAGVGTLNTGAFSLSSSSVLKFELGQPGVVGGVTNDLLSVSDALILDGTLQITTLANFGPGTYRLFDYTGSLTNNVLELQPAFTSTYAGSFIDVSTPNQVNLVVVPEPNVALSLLGGLGVLLGFRRRRTA